MRPFLLPWLLAVACSPPGVGPVARYEPGSVDFFATPWPSDARRTDDGHPDWSTFPNPSAIVLFDHFKTVAEARPGFAENAPFYVSFDGPIDTDLLPDLEGSLTSDASVQLIDITLDSPDFGKRVPIHWEFRPTAGAYVPDNLLSVAPVAGWPLRPRTTYAFVMTTAVATPADGFLDAWNHGDGEGAGSLEALHKTAPFLDLDRNTVAVASTFTTGDPTEEMDRIARFLDERVEPPTFRSDVDFLYNLGDFSVYRSDYATPLFMSGTKPYAAEGGAFVWRDDGFPEVQGWDPMRLSVVTPQDLSTPPPNGWPVLVSLHGTGGDYRTFCNSDSPLEIADWMVPMGVVGLSIDLPLHGTRGTPDTIIDLHSFNVLQPDSALHIHRQAAADLLYLLHGITDNGPLAFTLPDGSELKLDTSHVAVIGHSQGGITAALALPWLGGMAQGTMLSGAGGLLAITAVERTATVDFPSLIKSMLEFAPDEELTELHPVLGLVQSIVEPTDPINYAPYWFHDHRGGTGAVPESVLLTSGLQDENTPSRTAEALASAARMPWASAQYSAAPGLTLRGEAGGRLPLANNTTDWSGAPITAGFSQWFIGSHFVIFEDEKARDLTRNFVGTALQGQPELRKGPWSP